MKTLLTFATGLTCLALAQTSLAQSQMTPAQELKRALGTSSYALNQTELKAELKKTLNIKHVVREGFSVDGFRAILDLSKGRMTTIQWKDLSGVSEENIEETAGESRELIEAAKKNQLMEVRKYSNCSVKVANISFESRIREQVAFAKDGLSFTASMVEARKKYLTENGIKVLTNSYDDTYVPGTAAAAFVSCKLSDVGVQSIDESDIAISNKAKGILAQPEKDESEEKTTHFLISANQVLHTNPPAEMYPSPKKDEVGKLFFDVTQITEDDLAAKSYDDIQGEMDGFGVSGY